MAYTTNPHLPRVRQQAVNLVYQGWPVRKVGRHFGVEPSTVSKWLKKDAWHGRIPIPTISSAPNTHPNALQEQTVKEIVRIRSKRGRCAEIVHQELLRRGYLVSLPSVQRTLDRQGLTKKRSLWKRWHFEQPRPLALNPGDLVELDTIHIAPNRMQSFPRFYVYTLLDVFSRWAFAKVSLKINTHKSLTFVKEAQGNSPFLFSQLQSDHGSEFSTYFTENTHTPHRHSRVRQPNDNGHLERFNRTIQEECLAKVSLNPRSYQQAIAEYLPYYNKQRMHLGINFKTPLECVQGAD